MFEIRSDLLPTKTVETLEEAKDQAVKNGCRTQIYDRFTNNVLYEWSPEGGLRQFLTE